MNARGQIACCLEFRLHSGVEHHQRVEERHTVHVFYTFMKLFHPKTSKFYENRKNGPLGTHMGKSRVVARVVFSSAYIQESNITKESRNDIQYMYFTRS